MIFVFNPQLCKQANFCGLPSLSGKGYGALWNLTFGINLKTSNKSSINFGVGLDSHKEVNYTYGIHEVKAFKENLITLCIKAGISF